MNLFNFLRPKPKNPDWSKIVCWEIFEEDVNGEIRFCIYRAGKYQTLKATKGEAEEAMEIMINRDLKYPKLVASINVPV